MIHLTDPLGYDKGYHNTDEQPALTRGASDNGCYDYIIPEEMAATRSSAHRRILSLKQEIEVNKKFGFGEGKHDSLRGFPDFFWSIARYFVRNGTARLRCKDTTFVFGEMCIRCFSMLFDAFRCNSEWLSAFVDDCLHLIGLQVVRPRVNHVV